MDLRQIRYFIRIAELGSVSKAARQLNIAQPALSRHIQNLEAEFGAQLLARTSRGVEVTEAGRVLIEHGAGLLQGAAAMRDAVRQASIQPAGDVTVGLLPSISSAAVRDLVESCRTTFPDVRLRIVEGVSMFLEEWLDRGSLDLAIVTDRPAVRRFETKFLFSEDFLLVGHLDEAGWPEAHVVRADMARIEVVMTRGFREIVSEQLGPDALRCSAEVDSLAVIRDILDEGGSASILPRGVIQRGEWRERFRALPFREHAPTRSVVVARNPRRPRSAALRAVHQTLLARMCGNGPRAGAAPVRAGG